jgi:hypothetical protein
MGTAGRNESLINVEELDSYLTEFLRVSGIHQIPEMLPKF